MENTCVKASPVHTTLLQAHTCMCTACNSIHGLLIPGDSAGAGTSTACGIEHAGGNEVTRQ